MIEKSKPLHNCATQTLPQLALPMRANPAIAMLGTSMPALLQSPPSDYAAVLFGNGPALTQSGQTIRCVDPRELSDALSYEQRIYDTGVVATRAGNWHDLFNALSWSIFPRTKAAINAQHVAQQSVRSSGNRGRTQDTLTLLDESGVIVASNDAQLLDLIRSMQWKELFWHRRDDVRARMRFVVFGHGLCEQMLTPYVGLTGKALLLTIEETLLAATDAALIAALDVKAARWCAEQARSLTPAALCPLPILGVPGWWQDNEHESFYDNTNYFRNRRSRFMS